jgi:hypothetical protein
MLGAAIGMWQRSAADAAAAAQFTQLFCFFSSEGPVYGDH